MSGLTPRRRVQEGTLIDLTIGRPDRCPSCGQVWDDLASNYVPHLNCKSCSFERFLRQRRRRRR